MIPSADIRMSSMMRALTGTIIPALKYDENARSQAQMILAHLGALRAQYDWLEEFERLELAQARELATKLLATVESSYSHEGEVSRLNVIAHGPFPRSIVDVRSALADVNEAIAEFIALQGRHGSKTAIRESDVIIADAEYKQSLRNRSVFASFGYDSDDPEVLPVESMMKRFREEVSTEEAVL